MPSESDFPEILQDILRRDIVKLYKHHTLAEDIDQLRRRLGFIDSDTQIEDRVVKANKVQAPPPKQASRATAISMILGIVAINLFLLALVLSRPDNQAEVSEQNLTNQTATQNARNQAYAAQNATNEALRTRTNGVPTLSPWQINGTREAEDNLTQVVDNLTETVLDGEDFFVEYSCNTCHAVIEDEESVAANLAMIGSEVLAISEDESDALQYFYDAIDLHRDIDNAPSYSRLSSYQRRPLAAYLLTLRGD